MKIEFYILRAIDKRNFEISNFLLFEEEVYSDYCYNHSSCHFFKISMDNKKAYECWKKDFSGALHYNRANAYRFACTSCDKKLCHGCFVGCFNRKETYYES